MVEIDAVAPASAEAPASDVALRPRLMQPPSSTKMCPLKLLIACIHRDLPFLIDLRPGATSDLVAMEPLPVQRS